MERSLQRWKNQKFPPIPTSLKELRAEIKKPEIMKKYSSTYDGDGAFYVDTVISPDYDFTIFASPFVIDFVEKNIAPESRSYLMDGTFDSLPKGFYQLLIISIEHQNDVSNTYLTRTYIGSLVSLRACILARFLVFLLLGFTDVICDNFFIP